MMLDTADSRTGAPPRIVVADGDAVLRSGIRGALEPAGLRVCAEVATADAAIAVVQDHEPDVVLLSSEVEGGVNRVLAAVARRPSSPAVIVMATNVDEGQVADAIRLGAVGYIPKSIKPTSLAAAVRAVLSGEAAIPRALVRVLLNGIRDRPSYRHVAVPERRGIDLTSREWEVLELMRTGARTRDIAERLLISEITVRRHIGEVLKKLQVSSRQDALRLLQHA
jgi:DNA-binding NarL/FixJ family response regulator